METLHAQVAEPAYEITPLLVIFYALGGYSAEKKGEKALSKAKEIEKLLSNYLQCRNLIITLDGRGRLIFAQKS